MKLFGWMRKKTAVEPSYAPKELCENSQTGNDSLHGICKDECTATNQQVISDSLHTIIPSIRSSEKHTILSNADLLINKNYPLVQMSYEAIKYNGKLYISFSLKDYGVRDIEKIGYTLSVKTRNNVMSFQSTYLGVTYFKHNDFFIDIIEIDSIDFDDIEATFLFINYIIFTRDTNKHIVECAFSAVDDSERSKYGEYDKKIKLQTLRLSAAGSNHKAQFKEQYIKQSWKIYDELVPPFEILNKLTKHLTEHNAALSEDVFIKPNGERSKEISVPIKCYFDKNFYCTIYAAQYCPVVSKAVSDGGTLQYLVSVDRSNIDSLLFLYYLTIYIRGYFTYMSKEQIELQEIIDEHPARLIAKQIDELYNKYDNYPTVVMSKAYEEAVKAKDAYFSYLSDLRESIYTKLVRKGQYNRWVSEYKLFFHLRTFFPDAIYQYAADWLDPQTLDIYIPSISCGIEYQGCQHYDSIDHFGGEQSLFERIENDKRKKDRCAKNGVRLLEWIYETPIRIDTIISFFDGNCLSSAIEAQGVNIKDLPLDISSTVELLRIVPTYRKNHKEQRKEEKTNNHVPQFVFRKYDPNGDFIKEYPNIAEAALETGIAVKTILKVIYSVRKTGGGYIWRRSQQGSNIDHVQPVTLSENTGLAKAVFQISDVGEIIAEYPSIGQAVKATGINRRSISDALSGIQKTAGGYTWCYSDLTT